jgi:DNA-binding XRE family transcriptional regulator
MRSSFAPIVQWIKQLRPKEKLYVRIVVGAPNFMTTPNSEPIRDSFQHNAIIVSGDALHGLTDQELEGVRDDIAWMLRARLGQSAITVTAAHKILPVDRRDTDYTEQSIAHTMRGMRLAAGLSQMQLARAVESTQTAVSDIERRGRLPRIDTIGRIAAATDHLLGMYVARTTSDEDKIQALADKLARDRR